VNQSPDSVQMQVRVLLLRGNVSLLLRGYFDA
jgi:hypothetical protein